MACGYSPAEAQEPCRRNLAGDDFLQRQSDLRRDVADERDCSAFARAVDGGGYGFVAANGFIDEIDAVAVGAAAALRRPVPRRRRESFVCAELRGQFESRRVDVGDEYACATGGSRGLQSQQADHACADDESCFAAAQPGNAHRVQRDGDGLKHGRFGEGDGSGRR